ncbi:RNA polymerase subunit sigma-24 [Streptomyces thermoviolaceus subsp. thermoviolaceus]|uniref:SigE family RNA polymerase sigma factor n=1 Tax=Streptomyces thermoviolaceus subsp. thermoviolaceus TaxID=66860 RepID=A0ABX0YM10_STRTL|nr:SigE family RNA polymerase sigma factor [Streptomyces thermoviolaceus subsp. thermoviolaceus]GHA75852.1 RNA polymerase subunit sigma-24 [Streptomyces thermoviolaceus subsp. thermoviolaceus]
MNPTGPLTRADHRGEAEEGAVSAHTAAVAPDTDRDTAVAALFETHHAGLLRLAVLLGAGPDAEDVVAEAFYQLQRRWGRIRDKDAAVGYLRGVILNLTRMRFRHLRVVRRHAQQNVEFAEDSAEQHALLRDEHRHVVSALRTLPTRQHQVLVLRYWLDLSEAEIARTMGISQGAVKSHASRGMAKLSSILKGAET